MRLVIKKVFRDKITKEVYKVDDVRDFSDDRAEELLSDARNLVEKAKEDDVVSEEPKKVAKKRTTRKSK